MNIRVPEIPPVLTTIAAWGFCILVGWAALSFGVMLCWNVSLTTLGVPALNYVASLGLIMLIAIGMGAWYIVFKDGGKT